MILILAVLVFCLAVFGQGIPTPARISDSRTVPATLDTKVLEIRDLNGSGLKWNTKGEVTASSTNRLLISDSAGNVAMELSRKLSSTTTNEAIFDLHLIPRTDNARLIGSASKRWSEAYINRLRSNFATPPTGTLELDGDLTLTAGNTIGMSGNRIPKIWVVDFDCSGTGCPGGASVWTRNSGSGYLEPTTNTDDIWVRKLVIKDTAGSGLFWDLYGELGNPASQTNRVFLRDGAGVKVIEFERTLSGSTSNTARLDMTFEPLTDGTRNLGASAKRWANGYINHVRANFITPPTGVLEVDGDLTVSSGNSIGLSAQRIPKIWVQDFDCAGTGCPATSPWQRNSGTGVVSLITATDDTLVRKVRWDSNDASGLFWDSYATVTGSSPGTREWQLRDNAGAPVLRLQRQFAGAVVDDAILDMDFLPATDGARSLGASAKRWDQAHLNKVYTTLLTPGAGSSIEIDGSWLPTSAASGSAAVGTQANPFNVGGFRNLYTFAIVPISGIQVEWFNDLVPQTSGVGNLGSSSRRVGTLYTTSIDCSGGTCPSSKWTDAGTTTYLTATGDNVAIGLASTSFKFEVAGTSKLDGDTRFGGDLFCVTDAGCDLGDNGFGTVLRPSSGHFASALFTYNGGGSSVIRTSLSGSGLIVNNSGGTQVASVSGTTGRISTSAGFTVSGINGLSVTTTAGCVFTGGILTTSC
jgi:hypothetical protein